MVGSPELVAATLRAWGVQPCYEKQQPQQQPPVQAWPQPQFGSQSPHSWAQSQCSGQPQGQFQAQEDSEGRQAAVLANTSGLQPQRFLIGSDDDATAEAGCEWGEAPWEGLACQVDGQGGDKGGEAQGERAAGVPDGESGRVPRLRRKGPQEGGVPTQEQPLCEVRQDAGGRRRPKGRSCSQAHPRCQRQWHQHSLQ